MHENPKIGAELTSEPSFSGLLVDQAGGRIGPAPFYSGFEHDQSGIGSQGQQTLRGQTYNGRVRRGGSGRRRDFEVH